LIRIKKLKIKEHDGDKKGFNIEIKRR